MPDYRPTGTQSAYQGSGQASRPPAARYAGPPSTGGGGSTNLADLLERVLDKGIVIAGDIQINLLDIELLTIKIRLLIASVDRAKEMGINWWETDPSLTSPSSNQKQLTEGDRQMVSRLDQIEEKLGIEPPDEDDGDGGAQSSGGDGARGSSGRSGTSSGGSSGGGAGGGDGSTDSDTATLQRENADLRERLTVLERRLGEMAGGTETPAPPTRTDLRSLTVSELRDRARTAGLEGYSSMRKSELVAEVRSAEASATPPATTDDDDEEEALQPQVKEMQQQRRDDQRRQRENQG